MHGANILLRCLAALLVVAEASAWSSTFLSTRASAPPLALYRRPPRTLPPCRWPPTLLRGRPARAPHPLAGADLSRRVALEVDLGVDGEPKGTCRLIFTPLLERSNLIVLDELRVPLGMLIEEADDGRIVVTGALPGYSAIGRIEPGDLIRAVTAYRGVVADAPMWQQMMSYTPVGKVAMKRLIFRTEGARYQDVRDAIASHREEEGGNSLVTLVVERQVNASTPLAPRGDIPQGLEPLQEVIKRDLQRRPVSKGIEEELQTLSPAERARRLFELGFDVPPPD